MVDDYRTDLAPFTMLHILLSKAAAYAVGY